MRKISTNLWFDSEAEEASRFYASLFRSSKIGRIARYGNVGQEIHGQPEGKVMTVELELKGQSFVALNGGPIFKFAPSLSFLIACRTHEEVRGFWEKLSPGGTALMELGAYPFSELYGWIQDRYGLSWQVMDMGDRPISQKITPTLMFTGAVSGRCEEAVRSYVSIFDGAKVGEIMRYNEGEEPDKAGTVRHAAFRLEGREFAAMDSARPHGFTFNEAVSFVVDCESQAEIDHFWTRLSEGGDPNAQQCGWLKDRYGVSWQVVPAILSGMMHDPDAAKGQRVMAAFLKMKKLDIAELKRAFEGR